MNKIIKPNFIARTPKALRYTLFAIGSMIMVFFIAEFFRTKVGGFAGAYPFAESWRFYRSVDFLKTSLQVLKIENPQLFCTVDTLSFEADCTGYWRKVQFCYQDKIVHALIRGYGRESTLTLVSIKNNNDFDVKLINRDFGFFANRREINAFKKYVIQELDR